MKKLLISFLLILFFSATKSQLNKGTWLTGGAFSFYAYTSDFTPEIGTGNKAKYTQINLSAMIGYFVADKIAFGLRPTFSSLKNRETGPAGGYTNIQRYWLGPFGRYYILEKEKLFNLVTDISYQYGFLGGDNVRGKLNTFSALAGPVIYFNSSVGLEFLFGYSSSKEEFNPGSTSRKDSRKGFQTTFGFQIHLEK